MSNLRNEIGNLSAAEKLTCSTRCGKAWEPDELSLTDGQRDELDYRLSQHQRNPDEVIPWGASRGGPV